MYTKLVPEGFHHKPTCLYKNKLKIPNMRLHPKHVTLNEINKNSKIHAYMKQ